ncbi:BatD family protein [Pseudomonas sp. GD03842]|uniref:BatD family protein n=1 Tax=unclassified Pseudomonas TaxID=196821 RepID=UPI000D3CD8BD|nr:MULTISPECIES: BatD family protein [unclassified Pseudomonas]MDH0746728.1 BatD family protein [Pseudomonas sp. GD03842]RAU45806.1 protein BatD [Pseudomonas sp. RIT 409]RAU56095.1 protein BatD [Pseudomonas sp. RIT 412]
MNRVHSVMIAGLWCLFAVVAQADTPADALQASVDRTRVNTGETVELTLESDDATLFGKPDMSALEADFEVRDTRQLNSLTTLEGNVHATTRWLITLMPRHSGSIEIPPLKLGQLTSQPITLQVVEASGQAQEQQLAPVFMEASLDQDTVYVQAQAVLTVRIYHSVSLFDDSNLTPLQLPDVRIEKLGDTRTYEKQINGIRHGVIEMRYALYPQQSGELTIPSQAFSATMVQDIPEQGEATRQPAMATSPKPGKLIRVTSDPLSLKVKPQPVHYPANTPWLPARSISLSENWNPDPAHTQIGDSLTRTLVMTAEGLSSAQLPPLPATDVSALRRYPDQPQLSNQVNERGLVGSREEREALVPNRPGAIDIPAVDVVWWNTLEDHLEHSALPAHTLQVSTNPALAVDMPVSDNLGVTVIGPPVWPWQLSTVLLAFTTLLGFGLWWRARWQPALTRAAQAGPSPRTVLDDLKRACLANDPQATRQALDAWARQQPETLADMAARFVPLSDALDGLNGALYSETGKLWLGEELWKAVRALPAVEKPVDGNAVDSLPPLYPK